MEQSQGLGPRDLIPCWSIKKVQRPKPGSMRVSILFNFFQPPTPAGLLNRLQGPGINMSIAMFHLCDHGGDLFLKVFSSMKRL